MKKQKVKIISAFNKNFLEKSINDWIKENEKTCNVINISYCVNPDVGLSDSALILYEENEQEERKQ